MIEFLTHWPSMTAVIWLLIGLPIYAAIGGIVYQYLERRWPQTIADVFSNSFHAGIWPLTLAMLILVVFPILGSHWFMEWLWSATRTSRRAAPEKSGKLPKATARQRDR